jgi:hypothetical protein
VIPYLPSNPSMSFQGADNRALYVFKRAKTNMLWADVGDSLTDGGCKDLEFGFALGYGSKGMA